MEDAVRIFVRKRARMLLKFRKIIVKVKSHDQGHRECNYHHNMTP